MKKRMLSALCALCLTASLLPTTALAADNSFTDVKADDYFVESVAWAVSNNITAGTSTTTFSPNQTCTRAQILTFLHRYFVKPLDNSEFVASLKPRTPAAPVAPMKLDPLPPVDYTKQADWYMSLTHVDDLSDARLLAEYESINNLIGDWRAQEIFITDSVYARQLDLWAAAKNRGLL